MPRRSLRFAWAVLTLALTLASCVSPEELHREDEATCTGFGFHPGTDAFANCLQKESLPRRYWAAPPPPYWGWGYWWGAGWGPYWP
jgi:hypothetical protein